MIGIYKITNKVNKKSYIGQSINIQKRIHQHFWKAICTKDISYHSALHSAIRKYGANNFQTEIIQECSVEEIDEKQKYYIKYYNTKVERPNREQLKKEIRVKSFTQLGKKYNVSDKAIVKWCKQYQLPFRKKDIILFTEQQWQII